MSDNIYNKYLVSKSNSFYEYRIYNGIHDDGLIVYSGHKMGVSEDLLMEILQYKIDRSSNRVLFTNYNTWYTKYNLCEITPYMSDVWLNHDYNSIKNDCLVIWVNLLQTLKTISGENVKNITISRF